MGEKEGISLKINEDVPREMKKDIPEFKQFFEEKGKIFLQTKNKDENQLKFQIKTKEPSFSLSSSWATINFLWK